MVSWWRGTEAFGRLPPWRLWVNLRQAVVQLCLRSAATSRLLRRFDPLSLASEKKALTWFQQAELVHCRTAMAAVAGIIIPGVGSDLKVLNLQCSPPLPSQAINPQACNSNACICPAAPHKGWCPAPATNLGGCWQGLDRVPPKLPSRYVSV